MRNPYAVIRRTPGYGMVESVHRKAAAAYVARNRLMRKVRNASFDVRTLAAEARPGEAIMWEHLPRPAFGEVAQ